eukprot:6106018-Pleurochrysis_carterae.AAC.4
MKPQWLLGSDSSWGYMYACAAGLAPANKAVARKVLLGGVFQVSSCSCLAGMRKSSDSQTYSNRKAHSDEIALAKLKHWKVSQSSGGCSGSCPDW